MTGQGEGTVHLNGASQLPSRSLTDYKLSSGTVSQFYASFENISPLRVLFFPKQMLAGMLTAPNTRQFLLISHRVS
jgi:hypothetical protein